MRLTEIDLASTVVIQQIGQQLSPEDRVAFATYVAVHGPFSAGTCGQRLRGHAAKAPVTVGDAIELMRLRTRQIQPGSGLEA